jgi:ArsR family transcriptional regulator
MNLSDGELAGYLKALGHPARVRIIRALAEAGACRCGDIVRNLPLAQSTVSEHIRILKAAGILTDEAGERGYGLDRAVLPRIAEALGVIAAAADLCCMGAPKTPAAELEAAE